MLGHRELATEDYFAMLRRRLWWIVIPVLIGPLIGYGISLKLPSRYTSQTLVMVEEQKVPEGFVKSVVTEQLNERLATMQEQILSRTRLQPIIERFGLYQDQGAWSMEDKVEQMRKMIKIAPVRADFGAAAERGGLPGFYISFTAANARLAQQVCSEITSMFMQENLRVREQHAEGTTDFLRGQLDDAKRALDEQDAKLAEFKRKYIGQLPGQEQTNFSMLASVNTQLASVTDALNRLQQERTYAESMLTAQVGTWRSAQTAKNPQTLQSQLEAAQASLMSIESKYTSTHPDVIKLKNDIANLEEQIAAGSTSAAKPVSHPSAASEPLQIQQLRAQLQAVDSAIKDKEREQAEIKKQIKNYEARLQLSPAVEEQYKALTRDYQTAVTMYNDLLNKKNQSEMATDLERKQQGEQFRVMDPPNLPEKPTFPDPQLFAGGGLAGGLVLGLVIAVLLELRDKTLRNERDIQAYLQLPTLALVPDINRADKLSRNGAGGFWKRRRKAKLGANASPQRRAAGA